MQLTYTHCDICRILIKKDDKKYILGLNPVTEMDSKDYNERYKKRYARICEKIL